MTRGLPLPARAALSVLILAGLPAGQAWAQAQDLTQDPARDGGTVSATTVVVVTGQKPDTGAGPGGNGQCPPSSRLDYACLNRALASASQATAAVPVGPSVTDLIGHGEPDKVGTFSHAGTKERLGTSFGISAIPQRPAPAPVYHPPLSAPPTPVSAPTVSPGH